MILWDAKTLAVKAVIKGVLQQGIANVCISHDGKKVAATSVDPDHCIAIYDTGSKVSLIGTTKLTPHHIFDLKFDLGDKTIVAAGLKEINFITFEGGVIKKVQGLWEKNCGPQACLCIGFIESNVITGMYKG
jgi:WD40 repeat protein